MVLGERIRSRREKLKLSQGYVAEQIGVSRQAVSKWETGQSEPTADNLVRLAEVFEISLAELVGADENDGGKDGFEARPQPKTPNLILRANLIRLAITAQAAFLFSSASMFCQMQAAEYPMKDLYRGALFVSLALLLLSSVWMASNHRWEEDMARRRTNARIELGYCCVYVLYVNPRFMGRKLTK